MTSFTETLHIDIREFEWRYCMWPRRRRPVIEIRFIRYLPQDTRPDPTLDTLAYVASTALGYRVRLRDVGDNRFVYWMET